MYLGLDLGTSGLKALLIREDQTVVAEATAPLVVSRPRPGWVEQDPDSWIAAARDALSRLGDLSGVRAVGLSGQMHGATMLDGAGRPLRPCLLWNDTRAAAEAAEMDDAEARRITGNVVFPGFTAPKVEWVRRHEPEAFAACELVLLPKDHLRLWLTGEAWSDVSDASGTAWLETGARDWSDDMLARTGLTRAHMPAVTEGSRVAGRVSAACVHETGLPEGAPVAGGGGDNAASAVGTGCVRPGEGFVSLGTSGVLFVAAPAFAPAPETAVHSFAHALPGAWHQMGVILAAADALEWAARLTGWSAAALSAGDVAAPGRTLFLPYLGGERTPHNDARLRGALLGLEHATDAAALGRAVTEGVAFAFADCADALRATGTELGRLWAVGGGARSRPWLGTIATLLGVPLHVPAGEGHGAALGAARLAMMADGVADAAAPPPVAEVVEPDAALADAFREGHERYRAAYQATREL